MKVSSRGEDPKSSFRGLTEESKVDEDVGVTDRQHGNLTPEPLNHDETWQTKIQDISDQYELYTQADIMTKKDGNGKGGVTPTGSARVDQSPKKVKEVVRVPEVGVVEVLCKALLDMEMEMEDDGLETRVLNGLSDLMTSQVGSQDSTIDGFLEFIAAVQEPGSFSLEVKQICQIRVNLKQDLDVSLSASSGQELVKDAIGFCLVNNSHSGIQYISMKTTQNKLFPCLREDELVQVLRQDMTEQTLNTIEQLIDENVLIYLNKALQNSKIQTAEQTLVPSNVKQMVGEQPDAVHETQKTGASSGSAEEEEITKSGLASINTIDDGILHDKALNKKGFKDSLNVSDGEEEPLQVPKGPVMNTLTKFLDGNHVVEIMARIDDMTLTRAIGWINGLWDYVNHSSMFETMLLKSQESLLLNIYITLSDQDKALVVPKFFTHALLMSNIVQMYQVITNEKVNLERDIENVINSILNTLHSSRLFLSERVYCLKQFVSKMSTDQVLQVITILKDTLSTDDEDVNLLMKTVNPVKLVVEIYELLQMIKKYHPLSKIRANGIIDELRRLVHGLMGCIDNINDVFRMFDDTLTNQEMVLHKASDLAFLPLFDSPIMNEVMSFYWTSTYQKRWIFSECSSFKIIKGVLLEGNNMNYEREFRFGKTPKTASKQVTQTGKKAKLMISKRSGITGSVYGQMRQARRQKKYSTQLERSLKWKEENPVDEFIYIISTSTPAHWLQFKVWEQSPEIKFIIVNFINFALAMVSQYVALEIGRTFTDFPIFFGKLLTAYGTKDAAQITAAQVALEVISKRFVDNFNILYFISCFQILFIFQNLLEIISFKLRKKKLQIIRIDVFLNFVILGLLIWWTYAANKYYVVEPGTPYPYTAFIFKVGENIKKFNITLVVGALIGLNWFRLLFLLQSIKSTGPLVKSIFAMVFDMVQFLIIFMVVFMTFTCVMSIYFSVVPGFATFNDSFLTLFNAALGNFDYGQFDIMDGYYIHKNYALVIYTLFLLVCNILLLNLLIAILSNTYAIFTERSQSLYLNEITSLTQIYGYDSRYGCLMSTFTPMNALLVPVLPFILVFKSKRLNKLIMHIQYIPIMLFSVFIFTFISVALLPFGYLLGVVNKISLIIKTYRTNKEPLKLILDTAGFMCLGLPILTITTIIDIVKFTLNLYTQHPEPRTAPEKALKLKPESMKILESLLNYLTKAGKVKIEAKKLIEMLSEMMMISQQIQRILYQNEIVDSQQLKTDTDIFIHKTEPLVILNEYNKLKTLILNNSYEDQINLINFKNGIYMCKQQVQLLKAQRTWLDYGYSKDLVNPNGDQGEGLFEDNEFYHEDQFNMLQMMSLQRAHEAILHSD